MTRWRTPPKNVIDVLQKDKYGVRYLDSLGKKFVTCKHFVLGVPPHLHKKKKNITFVGLYF